MNLNEFLISQYIDDELTLEGKALFLEELARDPEYSGEALALVRQEIDLAGALKVEFPEEDLEAPDAPPRRRWANPLLAFAAAACAVFALAVFLYRPADPVGPATVPQRFVVYMPEAGQVSLSGDFNGWQPIPMQQPGKSGYWEAVLDLPPGEYRFSYVVEGNTHVPDPTLLAREHDDFGGMNSILKVEAQT